MKIESILIEGFRGLLDSHTYQLDGKSLLVFAQNGWGKSSFVDAIDYFRSKSPNGQLGHLNAREYGGIKSLKHLNKVGDGQVSITFTNKKSDTRKVTNKGGAAPALAIFINTLTEYDWIFRLSDIMKILDAAPGERYEKIANAVGILPLMEISRKMDSLKRWGQNNPYNQNLQTICQELAKILQSPVQKINEQHFITCLCGKYHIEYDAKTVHNLASLKLKIREQKNKLKDQTGIKNAELALFQLEEILKKASSLEKLKDELKHAELDLKSHQSYSGVVSIIKVFEAASQYLHEHHPDNCPVCESDQFNWQTQKDRIDSELNKNKVFTALTKRIEEVTTKIASLETPLNDSLEEAETTIATIMKYLKEDKPAAATLELKPMSMVELISAVEELKSQLSAFVLNAEKTSNLENLINIERDIEDIERYIMLYQTTVQKQELFSTYASQIVLTADSFSNYCKSEMETRFEEVIERAQEIFSELVDNPLLESGQPAAHSFRVVPAKARELNLLLDYLGNKDIAPTGYLNESWMRAYGLSLVFALIEKGNETFPVLVLDDIFSSFDFPNQKRIANFLANNFKHFQLIITTHDAHFNKSMVEAIRRSNNNSWKTIEAYNYDRENGHAYYKNSLTEVEKIDGLFDMATHATEVSNPIRIFFENWCRIHCDLLSVSLVYKGEILNAGYDLGELWPPLQKVIKIMFAGHQESILLLDKIERDRSLLSFGSHGQNNYNEHSPVTDYKVLWDNIKKLDNILRCPECNKKGKFGYMRKNKSGTLICHGPIGRNQRDSCDGTSYNFLPQN
jgi:hypothetical protein